MMSELQKILQQIESASPANEAEVETKILLHIFRLLGFTDIDRADKPLVTMHYGRERKLKSPDFILYQGGERTVAAALIAVEAKSRNEGLEDAEAQARSYAAWAGTPYYAVCNGRIFRAVQYLPGAVAFRTLDVDIATIATSWTALYTFLSRSEVMLGKERLSYMAYYLPEVERLPPREFFREYLARIANRFVERSDVSHPALYVPGKDEPYLPPIPVVVTINDSALQASLDEAGLARHVAQGLTRVLITGEAGSGKSTICKRLAHVLASTTWERNSNIIPIYIALRDGVPNDTTDAFARACRDMGMRVFEQLFNKALSHTLLVVILDGLDELEVSDDIQKALHDFISQTRAHSSVSSVGRNSS
jgi:hypothetical protein